MITRAVVIGVDGGGSTTRAVCADLTGMALAYAETSGSNPQHHVDAHVAMRTAIQAVVTRAGYRLSDVVALVAGIAGLNAPSDHAWAEQHTALPGLACPRIHHNDAEVAHAGAFGTGPGVITIAGTGSVVFAVTEDGQRLWNDQFQHYAGGARHLAFAAMQRVLIGAVQPEDAELIAALLPFWQVPDVTALRSLVRRQRTADPNAVKRAYGRMAVIVTAACATSPLAQAVCSEAAHKLAVGIRLVGGGFAGPDVPVALIGALAQCPAVATPVADALAAPQQPHLRYRLTTPALPPVAGAVLLALRERGIVGDDTVRKRLATTIQWSIEGYNGPENGSSAGGVNQSTSTNNRLYSTVLRQFVMRSRGWSCFPLCFLVARLIRVVWWI